MHPEELAIPTAEELDALLQDHTTDPYLGDWDHVQDPDALDYAPSPTGFTSLASLPKIAGRNNKESIAWLNYQRTSGANWYRQCLVLQRSAREIPAMAPTAYSASLLTPESEKINKVADLRRGMIGFTKGSDPAGHVFDILGRRPGFDRGDPDGVLTISNDVVAGHTGHVGIVSLSYYSRFWGHRFLFGATWLNGYDFADFNAKPKPRHPTLGVNYEESIKLLKKALKAHSKDKDRHTYDLIADDIERMTKRYNRLKVKSKK